MEQSKGRKRHSDTELLGIEWFERAQRGKTKRQRLERVGQGSTE